MPGYNDSENLLHHYIKNESLRKHCYAVEAAMRFYAKKLNEDEERWAAAGLLHDLDWEMFPETHPNTAVPVLEEAGYDREIIDAILGHAYPDRTNVPRESNLAKYLFACDEITGFITAYSMMKENGLDDVETKSIRKKMKDKAFARNVSRDDIVKGSEDIGIGIDEHISNVIEAMKTDLKVNTKK
ncbi:MAG: HD domain-containing protein [bacterium]